MNSLSQCKISTHLDDAFLSDTKSSTNQLSAQSEPRPDAGKQALTALSIQLAFYATTAISLAKALDGADLNAAAVLSMGSAYSSLALAYLAVRNGQKLWAARLLAYPMLLLLSAELYQAGGLRSGAAVFFAPLLLFAGATMGRQGLSLCSGLALGMGAFVAGLEHRGLLPSAIPPSNYVVWLELFIALFISVVLLQDVILDLHNAQAKVDEAGQQQRDAQSRYFKAQKLEPMARLATGVAHDFNNLLGVIANVTASLRIETAQQPDIQELLDDLDAVTTRAGMMTGQLLAFNRPRTLQVQVIDVEEFVGSLVPLLSRLLGDEIQVACTGSTGDLAIEADRGQLEQVMLNLVVNARDAMPHGGHLTIDIGVMNGDHISVSVQDTGVGIADEIREKIFSAFFTTKETGTGLGLATVADIVDALAGSVQVESRPGRGSRFTITFPATRKTASDEPRSLSRVRRKGRGARVLLAEDHELMRRATQRMLEQAGYTVTSVVNGHDALVLLQSGAHFDVLLTDVSMPVLSGFDLAERLSDQDQGLPTVFVSGAGAHLSPRSDHFTFKTRYLAKPFAQQDLIDAIEECVVRPGGEVAQRT